MSDIFELNDGERADQLELARMVSGEVPRVESEGLAAYEARLERLCPEVPAFDPAVLRAARHRLDEAPPRRTRATWWRAWWLPVLALAALLLVVLPTPENDAVRVKSVGADLDYFLLRGGDVVPGRDGAVLEPGDRLQFDARGTGYSSVVLIGVDPAGVVSVLLPEDGAQDPISLEADGHRLLEGGLELDDARGVETFLAVFDPGSIPAARDRIQAAVDEGGHPGLRALMEDAPDIAGIQVSKR